MTDSITVIEGKITLLEKRKEKMVYSLYSIVSDSRKNYYAVEVDDGREAELALVGCEYDGAVEMFDKIVRGSVSTITLDDVVRDMLLGKKY